MRLRLAQVHDSGASDGDVPVYDTGTGQWLPQAPPSGAPTGAAGGVLSGTYPNPGFAVGVIPTTAGALTTTYVPMTVTVTGVPDLIWDADDNLILMEVPIP